MIKFCGRCWKSTVHNRAGNKKTPREPRCTGCGYPRREAMLTFKNDLTKRWRAVLTENGKFSHWQEM